MERIQQLEEMIKKYAEAYYTGQSIVSDETFDSLLEELRDLDPQNSLLKTTGWGYTPAKKIPHKWNLFIGSLAKIKDGTPIPAQFTSEETRISAKLDGLSVVSYYNEGHRVLALTRGTGTEGIDVTNKINIINPETKDLPVNFTGAVRGEVVLPWDSWYANYKELAANNPSANPRNTASGLLNRKDETSELKNLKYVVYKILYCESEAYNTIHDVDEFLTKYFNVAPFLYNIKVTYSEVYQEFQTQYPCDGLVFSNYNGDSGTLNWDEIAYKFQAESSVVTVTDVTWNVTRTGRMAPLIWFDPVELSGAIVQKCTGFNAEFIKNNKIGKGATIRVCRSNEVIPFIMEVITPAEDADITIPTVCPNCGNKLRWHNTDLICDTEDELQLPYYFISTVAPLDGAGWRLYTNIVEGFNLKNLDDLLVWLKDLKDNTDKYLQQLIDNKVISGEVTISKVSKVLKALTEELDPINVFIGFNISNVGWSTAESILKKYPDFLETLDENTDFSKLLSINGIGQTVVDALTIFRERMLRILNVVQIKKMQVSEQVEEQFKVAITGALSMKRSDFDALLQKRGIKQSDNFREIRYLITNNTGTTSAKMQKAIANGIKIISEEDFTKKYLN